MVNESTEVMTLVFCDDVALASDEIGIMATYLVIILIALKSL